MTIRVGRNSSLVPGALGTRACPLRLTRVGSSEPPRLLRLTRSRTRVRPQGRQTRPDSSSGEGRGAGTWPDPAAPLASAAASKLDPMDCSLPGSSVHGILQARILEWLAISFTRGWVEKVFNSALWSWKRQNRNRRQIQLQNQLFASLFLTRNHTLSWDFCSILQTFSINFSTQCNLI